MAQLSICITYKKKRNANMRDDVCATHHFAYNGNKRYRTTANRNTVKRLCFGFAFGNVEPVNKKNRTTLGKYGRVRSNNKHKYHT